MPRLIGSLALLLFGCGQVYPCGRSMFTGGAYMSWVAVQVGGDGESGVGGQEDRSAKAGCSAGPQNERRESSRYCHGRQFDGPEAEGKRREAPREESYHGDHQAGDLGARGQRDLGCQLPHLRAAMRADIKTWADHSV